MRKINTSLLCMVAVSCAGTSAVHAQHSVSVATEVERIENPLLSPISPGGATVVRLIPAYTYETEAGRIRSRFSAGAVLESSSNTALVASRNYPSLGYVWGYTWPTASLELHANLAESATRNTLLEDVGRATVDSRERTVSTGANWNKELTARTRLGVSFLNYRVNYDTPLLEDFREQEISSRYTWEATERTSYYVEPAYSRRTPAGAGPVSTFSRWQAGVRGELGPDWVVTAYAGQGRTGGVQAITAGVGGLQLTYTGSRLTSEAEWSKGMDAIGSSAAYVRTEALRLRVGYRLSEGATLSASVTRTESTGLGGATGNVLGVMLENELSARWSSVLGVEDRKSRDFIGASGRGWAARAGLVYVFPGR